MAPRFVILHGWKNRRPADHWERWLSEQLAERGLEVDYPQLPDPDEPDPAVWSSIVDGLVTRGAEPVTLVAHSLSASLWFWRLERGGAPGLVTRLAIAALPSPSKLEPTVVASFVPTSRTIDPLPGVEQIVFEGEGDHYAPDGVRADFAVDASIPVEVVRGGGHLIPGTGFGPWPRMLEWTLGDLQD